jgi:Concanavalin A-like lectin/glucanases superfamily
MSARGPFSVEAWVRSKQSYTDCPTCGFVVPVARSAASWQLGWAGTAPARGRDPLWVHDGIPGPPIGANGWTFTIYDGYHKHCSGCADDTTHYITAHRLQTTAPIEAGRWYHLVATYDGLSMRLYVDGALAGELGVGAIGDVRSAPSGLFGFGYAADEDHSSNTGASSSGQVQLQGAIDEGAYYGHELAAEQVADHYDTASSNPLSGQAGVSSAYRGGVANDNPYLWFPLDEHYTEASTRATCYPCPSYERTTAANTGAVGAPVRDITGPSWPLGAKDHGLDFRDGARIATTQGPKYPLPSSTTNMSVETWIQTAPGTPEKQAFYATPTCGSCSGMVGLRLNAGALDLRADNDGFTFNTWQSLGGQGLNDGRWHHLIVVREFAYYTRALEESRVDYDALLSRHAPQLMYDNDELYYPLAASAITDLFVDNGQDRDSNSLKNPEGNAADPEEGVFAIANPGQIPPNGTGVFDRLELDYLRPTIRRKVWGTGLEPKRARTTF